MPPILGTKLPFFNLRNKEQEHKKLSLLGANLHWYRCSLYAKTLAKVISSYNVCSFLSFLIKRDLGKIFDTAVFITSDHIISLILRLILNISEKNNAVTNTDPDFLAV